MVDAGQNQGGVIGGGSAGGFDGTGLAVQICTEVATGKLNYRYFTPTNAPPAAAAPAPPPPSALDLAYQALARLHLPLPHLLVPGNGHPQLVGFPVWLWIDKSTWHPQQQSAAVPDIAVTATARPESTTFTFDDGTSPLHCAGPGTPWQRGVPGSQQHSDCIHTFTHHGTHRVTGTVTWHLTWTATNGEAAPLPAVDRTSSITLQVQEAQAVID